MLMVVKQDNKYTQVVICQAYRKCEQDLAYLIRNKKEAFKHQINTKTR